MAHVLDGLIVFDAAGRHVRLGELWAERTAVLLFVRHFGCVFCRQQVAAFMPWVGRIRSARAEVFVIGHGSVDEARAFGQECQLAVPLLTDPSRESYCALEMRRGAATVFHPSVVARAVSAFAAGFRQSKTAGDPLQQGGVVVMGPGGIERYRHISRFAGDHPGPAEILRHCEERP
jgi:peroxiredoxin